ncbi:MAG: Hsp70 family protein [Lachnospiraceae bacterium]
MLIGIDLGTTNCLAAYFGDEEPKLIPNKQGEYLTPSVISIDEENQLYIGATAKERKVKYPNQTVEVFKRSMGTEKKFSVGHRKMDALTLSSIMLRALREDAERFLGEPVTEAIISVPAYFNELQRKTTKDAGELAGLTVKRIINEPTAAALAYGIGKKDLDEVVLVFDLGGGTFDVSILEFCDGIVEVHAIAGDNYIGGEDFTQILVELFLDKAGCDIGRLSKKEIAHVRNQCEAAKKEFSLSNDVSIVCHLSGTTYHVNISLTAYEAACQKLLEKMKVPIERSLKDSSFKLSDIDDIILVGGGTKLRIVERFIVKLFARFPNMSVNPDEAVALGAAIQCAMSQRNEAVKEIVLTDVCPFSLGTSVLRKGIGKLDDQLLFYPIIERNTVIPVSRTETFYTVEDNQKRIIVEVLQGESRFPKNNLLLGTVSVKVPPAPAGQEAIHITYTYDVNALLEVKVKVESTGQEKTIILQQSAVKISDEEAKARMRELDYLKILPWEQEINKQVIFRGERLYEESLGDIRFYIQDLLSQFDEVLAKQNQKEIDSFRKKLIKAFDEIESLE